MHKTPRIIQEEKEAKILSKYATLSKNSKGRLYPIKECNIRTVFQRDRDRIIYSKAFRRLKHKTQVFIKPEGDHYRTRLTHTLEVAQISRNIARALNVNEDLTEAISLGHDLGHSPFGHAGERALDKIYHRYDKTAHFRHAEQSLRVVDILERPGGLNLTFEVRDGILNHAKGRSSEILVTKNTPSLGRPATIEGEVVRLSDRIAYISHDIDDAIRGGIIKEKDLPKKCKRILGNSLTQRISTMVIDVVKNSYNRSHIKMSPEVSRTLEELKEFMFERVYVSSSAKVDEEKAERLVKSLFDYFMGHHKDLPKYWQGKMVDLKLDVDNKKDLARAVCDFIAGMSDHYALTIFENIFVPKGWIIMRE